MVSKMIQYTFKGQTHLNTVYLMWMEKVFCETEVFTIQ